MKTCLYCKHFNFDMGSPSYSELTPGADAEFYCFKKHWRMGNYGSREEFVKHMESAEGCKDYEQESK